MKILPAGAELCHADRRTDRQIERHDEANSSLSQFRERVQRILKIVNKKNDPWFSVNLDPQLRERKIKFHRCRNTK